MDSEVEPFTKRGECTMKLLFLIAGLLACTAYSVSAQSVRSLVNGGNDLYAEKKFSDAEVNYKKALEKDITSMPGHYNLGNSLYRQDKFDESIKSYEDAVQKSETKQERAQAYYNLGDAYLKAQKYQEAVKSLTESLMLRPEDQDAKYNLSYALAKLRAQQQQQQNKKNDKQDKNKDKQDQNKQDENKQDQKNDQNKPDEQKEDQQKPDQTEQQQQQAQPQQGKKMSKADAERILDVLKNSEKQVQKKLRARVTTRAKTEKDW